MSLASDLLAAQDKAASQIEKDFLSSIKATVQATDWDHLERDLAAYQHGDAIIDGVAWEDFDPKERLKDLFSISLDINGANIGKLTGGAKFDFVDPRALTWIDKYCGDLIVQIDNSTKDAIKAIVKNGYANGVTPRQQARQIREIIGLDTRRAESLQKYADNLFSKGFSESEVWRLVEKKGQALLNARANLIAINETSEASANATYWSTKSAVERGVLSRDEWEGYRIVAADERLCSKCAPIAGEARELPDGTYASTGSNTSKVHVKCRCTEGLRKSDGSRKKTRNYEVSADNITNEKVLNQVLNKFDSLSKDFPVNNLFGGFRSLDNANVAAVIKNNAGDAFVTAWGPAFDGAGNRLRDKIGDPINKIFVYLPPKNINEGIFSEQLARMGIVHNGSMEGVVTHEFAHVLQLTAENKFGRNVPKSALEAAADSFRASGITPKMLQKNVSMYANGFGAGDLAESERFAEMFTAIHAPAEDKVSKAFADKLLAYQKKTNAIFNEYGGVGKIV